MLCGGETARYMDDFKESPKSFSSEFFHPVSRATAPKNCEAPEMGCDTASVRACVRTCVHVDVYMCVDFLRKESIAFSRFLKRP